VIGVQDPHKRPAPLNGEYRGMVIQVVTARGRGENAEPMILRAACHADSTTPNQNRIGVIRVIEDRRALQAV
jgi:hypothetical protein